MRAQLFAVHPLLLYLLMLIWGDAMQKHLQVLYAHCTDCCFSSIQLFYAGRRPAEAFLSRELVPVGAEVCCCKLPAAEAVALDADARLLACARGRGVDVYLIQALVDGRSPQPLATWQLPDGAALKQAWRMSATCCQILLSRCYLFLKCLCGRNAKSLSRARQCPKLPCCTEPMYQVSGS